MDRRALRYGPLALVGIAVAAVFATGLDRSLTTQGLLEHRETLQRFVQDNGSLALLVYMAVYIGAVTLSIPIAVVLNILGGFLFGWLVGGAAAVVSATIGAIGIFLIARTSIGDGLVEKAGDRVRTLAAGFRRDAFAYVLFLRMSPFPFWLTNLASALFGVPLRAFALATMIGLLPLTFAFAFGGSGLDRVIERQQAARAACIAAGGAECPLQLGFGDLVTPQLGAAIFVVGLFALLPILLRRFGSGRWQALAGRGGRKADP